MRRPKVEAPLYLENMPRREKRVVVISKVADEYFIRKPDSSILFPKPNRWEQNPPLQPDSVRMQNTPTLIILDKAEASCVCVYYELLPALYEHLKMF